MSPSTSSPTPLDGDHRDADTLRVGVIGLGYAGTTHLESFRSLPGIEVVALAGKERERLELLSAQHGIAHTYADGDELIARDDLDIVSIATPNVLHDRLAVTALEGGKHVFCEKPLAVTAEGAQAMIDAATRAGRVLDAAFNHRRRADVQWVADYLRTEGIGRIYHARASWKRRSGIPGLRSWFTSLELAGGGALIDLGPHVIDTLLHLLGEPRVRTVSAVTHGELGRAGYGAMDRVDQMTSGADFGVEDLAAALLRLEDGASVALEISWAGHTVDDEDISIELLGVDGGVRLFIPRYKGEDTIRVFRDRAGTALTLAPDVRVAGGEHPVVIAEFVETVRAQREGRPVRDEAEHHRRLLERVRIIDACYRSAAQGQEVVV
ncbi:Gfo/Idh/MocA family protein [Microbacterium sp. T2.11-28]|uniref:Gfo/Idh/MocA family protein n=1 Tax=Microbacterium sp. T2.11-28 TaxID=3041169 RepID=UPI002477AEC4|nr:Gfo/Idh/MocA family oxidoreductase [Microbacterium sp. T2.11-28]CAI9393019.1 Putative UDP-kanosamine synthase oxidoreductase subunit [Microbacterium sp. T2.11-28]